MFSRMEMMSSTSNLKKQEDFRQCNETMFLGKTYFPKQLEREDRYCETQVPYYRGIEIDPVGQTEMSRNLHQKCVENEGKWKKETDQLKAQNHELRISLDQAKQDIEVMRNRFFSLMSTLDSYNKCVDQVATETPKMVFEAYSLTNKYESVANKMNRIVASTDAKLDKNKDQLICDLKRQLQSAKAEFDQKNAWPYQETRPALRSDTVQFSGNHISALQNAVIDSENKISRLNELLNMYTKEIELNLQVSKEHSTAAQKDRELSTLFEQVETLKTELETMKNKARETEKELKQANVSAEEKDELVNQIMNKLGKFKTDIFRLQSAFKEFCRWKNQIRSSNDKTETWFSVVEHLEIRIKDLVEDSEDMTVFKQRTAYAPKLHKPLTDLSHTKERSLEMGCGIKNTTKINDEEKIKLQELKDKERLKELQNSEAALLKEVSDLQDKCSQYDEKIASLRGNFEKVEREKISAETFSEELKQKNQELQAFVNSLKDRCQKQKETNEGMQGSHLQETKRQQLEIKQLTDSLQKKESAIQECQNKLGQTMVGHEEVKQKHEKELAQLASDSKKETKKYIDEICQLKEKIEELESMTFLDFRPDSDIAEKLEELTVELLISQEARRRIQEEKDKLQKEHEELKEQIKQLSADNKMSGSKDSLSKTYSDCTSPGVRKMSKSSMPITPGKISPKDQANKRKDYQLLIPDLGFTDVVRKDAPCSSGSDDKLSLCKKRMTSTYERENKFSEEISEEPQSGSENERAKGCSQELSEELKSDFDYELRENISEETSEDADDDDDDESSITESDYEYSDSLIDDETSEEPWSPETVKRISKKFIEESQSGSDGECEKRFSKYELSDKPQSGSSEEPQSGSDSEHKKRFSKCKLSKEPQSGSDGECKKRFSKYKLSKEPQSGSSEEPQSGSDRELKKRFSTCKHSDEPQSGSDGKCKKRFSKYELRDGPQSGSDGESKKRFSEYELSDEPMQEVGSCSNDVVGKKTRSPPLKLQLGKTTLRPVKTRPIEQGSNATKVLPPLSGKCILPPISTKPTSPLSRTSTLPPLSERSTPSNSRQSTSPLSGKTTPSHSRRPASPPLFETPSPPHSKKSTRPSLDRHPKPVLYKTKACHLDSLSNTEKVYIMLD
ncbi:golgin subfamily A member 4-like [Nothobranchius furzeri]|uniref:Golgin subfamily A member 4-like n=1 Tax=Nothobranchius furzeri TaxID=105023 RepID=A0A9D2XFS4_NOTFU|nr:golgin subfamily A member 4-like [Nothobranchius furzeri]